MFHAYSDFSNKPCTLFVVNGNQFILIKRGSKSECELPYLCHEVSLPWGNRAMNWTMPQEKIQNMAEAAEREGFKWFNVQQVIKAAQRRS